MAVRPESGEAGSRSALSHTGRHRYSLRSMMALLVLATALPLVGIWSYTTWHRVQLEVARANQTVVALADAVSVDTVSSLDELRRLLVFLAGREQVRSLDPRACDPLFGDIQRIRPDVVNVATVDLSGHTICGTLKAPDGKLRDIGETAWLRELRRTEDFVIDSPQRGIYTGRWVLVLAYPVRDLSGDVRGAVEVVVSLATFQPMAQANAAAGGMIGILSAEGVVIARNPEGERLVGTNLRDSPLARMVLEKRTGTGVIAGQSGNERFHAFKPIGSSSWYAVAGLPTSTIYEEARHATWQAAGMGALTILFAGLLVLVIQRRVAIPMLALTNAAQKAASGDFSVRAFEGSGPAEVAAVAAGMNHMLERIPHMEAALRESEARYRKLVEEAPEAIVVHRNGRLLLANAAADRLYGLAEGEHLAGRHAYDFIDPEMRAVSAARAREVLANTGPLPAMELRQRRADGAVLDVETVAVRIEYEGAPAIMVLIRDVSARKAAERRVARLTSLYAALSKTNEAIFRHTDLLQICQTVCGIAVEDGGLAAAIVRVQDPDSRELAVYAHAGAPIGWVRGFRIPLDHPFNNSARVAREGKAVVVNDFATDDSTRESRAELMGAGLNAAAMFPLPVAGRATSVLSVFAREAGYFDTELVALLEELARSLAFAFARQRDSEAYSASEERYRMLFDAAPDAIRVICDGRVEMVNPAAVRLFGYADAGEMIGRPVYDNIDETHLELARERLRVVTTERRALPLREHLIKRADGGALLTEARLMPVDFNGKPAALAILRDLTERKAAELRVQRLTRLYAALSHTNEAIFRNSTPGDLYAAVSDIVVRHGGLSSAVVRMIAPETRMLEPNAYCGPESDWMGRRPVSLDDPASNAARVAREGGRYVCNDTWTDPRALVARADAQRVGVRSAATIALSVDGAIAGVLSVCATDANFFDDEMTGLLEEIAGNLSFALAKMKSAAALASTEGRYRALFGASPEALRVFCDERVVMINPAAVKLLGYRSADEVLGIPAGDAVAPEFAELARRRLRIVIEDKVSLPVAELSLRRADGSFVQVETVAAPFEFDGRPAVLSISRDLTERKLAENRLARVSSLYTALSKTNEAILRAPDVDTLYRAVCEIVVNEGGLVSAAIRLHEPAAHKLVLACNHGPCGGWIGGNDVDLDRQDLDLVQRLFRDLRPYVINDFSRMTGLAHAGADADRHGVRAMAGFPLVVEGRLAGLFSVYAGEIGFFDAELKHLVAEIAGNLSFAVAKMRGEAALAGSEERYRSLFDASPDAIRVLCDDKVVMVNPAAVRLFGLAGADDMIGADSYRHVAPEFQQIVRERIRKVTVEHLPAPPIEQQIVRADGTRLEVEVTSMPYEFKGRPAALVILHDLTARKEIERATLRLNAELEERVQQRTAELSRANAELESFSYSVAHDLRAPLRSMTGFAQLLAMDVEAGDTLELAAHIRRITENSEKMNRLIDGLLNVSNSTHRKLAVQRVDMRAVAEEVLADSSARERARVVIGPMPAVEGDPAALRQVWANLVSNALKYSAKQSQPAIELGCEPGAGMAVFRVQDNGVGFNAAYSEKLFGVFSRLHSASEFEGIGIGLAIVKRVVERHGGRVWAESSPNAGATFYFSLPLAAAPAQEG